MITIPALNVNRKIKELTILNQVELLGFELVFASIEPLYKGV